MVVEMVITFVVVEMVITLVVVKMVMTLMTIVVEVKAGGNSDDIDGYCGGDHDANGCSITKKWNKPSIRS